MAIEYAYPTDITDDQFEHRHVKIYVKMASSSKDSASALSKAYDDDSYISSFLKSAESTMTEISKNLDSWSRSSEGETESVIVLPLPNSFVDSQNHGWSVETGVLGAIGESMMSANLASGITSLTRMIPQLKNSTGRIGGGINKGLDIIDSFTGDITVNKVLGSSTSSMGLRKPMIDPGYFQNYSGSTPRTFSMEYMFIPRNKTEAETILTIITKLKQYSSPSKSINGVSIKAPSFFKIDISNNYIKPLINMARVVLTNISVDYGADGFMQQTGDGIPKQISLSLQWAEVDMKTLQDYNTKPGG